MYVNVLRWGITGDYRAVKVGPGRPSYDRMFDPAWAPPEYAVYAGSQPLVFDITEAPQVLVYATDARVNGGGPACLTDVVVESAHLPLDDTETRIMVY